MAKEALRVPILLLLLGVLGFCGRVGLAARAGFAPCGNGGFGLTGPPGELEEEVALIRGTGSGLISPRGVVLSGEPVGRSDLLMEPLGKILWGGLRLGCSHIQKKMHMVISCIYIQGLPVCEVNPAARTGSA